MADLKLMIDAARRAMVNVLELKPTDRVLVVQDPECWKCSQAFLAAAEAEGCTTTAYVLPEEGRPLQAMPDDMAATLEDQDVVINIMSGSSDEVPFRIEWLNLIEGLGLRLGHSPNIQEDMMDGGPMDVDYGQMVLRADRLLDALEGAVSVHITAPAGSDFSLDLTDRRFVTDVKITEKERGVNLPCGEIYGAPVEDGAEGVVVADGSIGGEGPPPSPVSLELMAGRVETVHCADAAWQERINELLDVDDGARVIAELGIGLNPGARLVGFMLEDEKAYRTIHVAFGSNEGMPGGVNISATHIDYLITMPTMTARFADGSERVILEDGDILP
jgi:aminopeptidase